MNTLINRMYFVLNFFFPATPVSSQWGLLLACCLDIAPAVLGNYVVPQVDLQPSICKTEKKMCWP